MKAFIILTLIDILSTARILWVDGHAQYAPLSIGDNLHGYPLIEENYNLMITVLIINIVVVIYKLIRKRYLQTNRTLKTITLSIYSMVSISCMTMGYIYIVHRSQESIINEYNILFKLPISLFGKDTIQRTFTAGNVYVTLSITLLSIIISYILLSFKYYIRTQRK